MCIGKNPGFVLRPVLLIPTFSQALDYPHSDADRKLKLGYALNNLQTHKYDDPALMQPSSLLREAPKVRPYQRTTRCLIGAPLKSTQNPATGRLAEPTGISRASSSTSTRGTSTSTTQRPPPFDPAETEGARAKREEAERERALAMASGDGGGYDEPTLPRWEPRRPPPGRGPGSIDETVDATKALSGLSLGEEQSQGQAPRWEPPQGEVPDDSPPGYS
jgi:hypothetical protein